MSFTLFTEIKFLRKFPKLQYSQSSDTVSLYEFIMWMKIGLDPDRKPAELIETVPLSTHNMF